MRHARAFLGGHRFDVDGHGATAVLPRCLADQIDEFRFVGHGRLLQVAKEQSAPAALTEGFRNRSNWKGVAYVLLADAFSSREPVPTSLENAISTPSHRQ